VAYLSRKVIKQMSAIENGIKANTDIDTTNQQDMQHINDPDVPEERRLGAAIASLDFVERFAYDGFISLGWLPVEALQATCEKNYAGTNIGELLERFSEQLKEHGIDSISNPETDQCVNVSIFRQAIHCINGRHDQALLALEKSEKSAEIEKQIRSRESILMDQVVNQEDPANPGKKLYTNDTARKAAHLSLCESDKELIALQEQYKQLRFEASTHQIDERYFADLVGIYRAFAPALIAAQAEKSAI
jgi:hypothetical protein